MQRHMTLVLSNLIGHRWHNNVGRCSVFVVFFLLKTSVLMFFSLNTHTNHSHAQPRSVARVSGWALNWLEESKLLSFMFMKPEGRSTGHYTCKTRIDCVDQLTVNHNDQYDRQVFLELRANWPRWLDSHSINTISSWSGEQLSIVMNRHNQLLLSRTPVDRIIFNINRNDQQSVDWHNSCLEEPLSIVINQLLIKKKENLIKT